MVRIRKGSDNFVESAPCHNCTKTLKKYGFKNIYYSNNNGGVEKMRIKDLTTNHNSSAQKNLEKYISHKHK